MSSIKSQVPSKNSIIVFIDHKIESQYKSRIYYAFQEMLIRFNYNLCLTNVKKDADIIYGETKPKLAKKTIFIRHNSELFSASEHGRKLEFYFSSYSNLKRLIIQSKLDPIGWIFRFLTLLDEKSFGNGRYDGRINSLPKWRRDIALIPIVDELANIVADILIESSVISNKQFGFETYKLLLTHDSDSSNISSFREIATNLVKGFIRLDINYLKKSRLGFTQRHLTYELNSHFAIDVWVEKFPKYKQLFLLSVASRFRHFHDTKSNTSDNKFPWNFLKNSFTDENIDFALHSSINSYKKITRYIMAKDFIETHLDWPILGNRSHYWSIDWKQPFVSYRKLIRAGFRFDMTMTYREGGGLRAGTCLPYKPYDLQSEKPLNIFIIPTCIMDSFAVYGSKETKNKILKMITRIKHLNGIVNLDWHTETINEPYPYEGYIKALRDFLIVHNLNSENSELPMCLLNKWISRYQFFSSPETKLKER